MTNKNKANLRDLIAANGLVIINSKNLGQNWQSLVRVTFRIDG